MNVKLTKGNLPLVTYLWYGRTHHHRGKYFHHINEYARDRIIDGLFTSIDDNYNNFIGQQLIHSKAQLKWYFLVRMKVRVVIVLFDYKSTLNVYITKYL